MLKEQMCEKCRISLQEMIDAMNEGYGVYEMIFDQDGAPIDYRFLEVNHAFEEITGYRREQIIGKTIKEIYSEADSFWINIYGQVALTKIPTHFENFSKMLKRYFKVSVFTPGKGKVITLFTDITDLKKTEELMKKHKLLFECAQDAVLYVGGDGSIQDVNQAACQLYDYPYETLVTMNISEIRADTTQADLERQMRLADDRGNIFEAIGVKRDGTRFPVEISARGTLIGKERIGIHIVRDITERKLVEEQMLYYANHDFLTGLPNRAYFMKELEKHLELAKRGKYQLAIMFFDIDRFKYINDAYGHQGGDEVLKTIAHRIKHEVRETDMVARLGGDEFTIIQTMIQGREDAIALLGRIFDVVEKPILYGEASLTVDISVGVTLYSHGEDKEALIKAADTAMYEAKKRAGNSYRFYQSLS